MNDASEAYEKILRLTATWTKASGKLPPPFTAWSAADSSRNKLSQLGISTLRKNRKVDSQWVQGWGQIVPTLPEHDPLRAIRMVQAGAPL